MTAGSRKRVNSKKELQKQINKRQERERVKNEQNAYKPLEEAQPQLQPQPKLVNPDPWTPGSYVALKAILSARLCAAIWSIINDCDETYNYWEPTHFLLYGSGFQTWEYSPVYALRSYTYLLVHTLPAFVYSLILQSNRMLVFFFIRCLLALIASGCELYFYRGLCKEFGANVGRITLGISVFSAGMFVSSTAYLPASFAMYMTMLSFGAWFHNSPEFAIFTTALSAYLGWPFAALIGAPIAIDIVIRKRKYFMFCKWCFISTFTILAPMVQIDSSFFGRLVVAPWNLVRYNMFSSHGPDLYGTSPPSFYLFNGLLNFNVLFPAALLCVPLSILCSIIPIPARKPNMLPVWLPLLSLYAWLVIFVAQPHKEERFMFPIYPLISLGAAIVIDTFQKLFYAVFIRQKKHHYLHYTNWISVSILVLSSVLSVSRIVGQYQGYRAPFDIFLELQRLEQEGFASNLRSVNLCYGREWHRFPSSFFLPSLNWEVRFIESDFRGLLPQPFPSTPNGTLVVPPHMNDENKEEPSRYIQPSSCHFIIDIDREEETKREPRYSLRTSQWKVIYSVPFLDASRSSQFLRAFYVPFLTEKYCSYVNYVILQSTKLNRIHPG